MLKPPVWKPEVAWYFWLGGLAGASAPLALGARLAGNARLNRAALLGALAGAAAGPVLLVHDLGRPARFLNMLRVFKVTSPMSVGSWVLAGFGAATAAAAASEVTGRVRPLGRLAEVAAAALGPVLSTYTAVLVANTATPVWHEARRLLPAVFAGGSMASAGGLASIVTPVSASGPARRLAVIGAAVELIAAAAMERRLGSLARPYRAGGAARPARLARALTVAGAAAMLLGGRRRWAAAGAGAMLAAGSLAQRQAVLRAGAEPAPEPPAAGA